MNSKILEHYKKIVDRDLQYLENSTIRKSLELYKEELEKETAKLTDENDRNHNLSFLNSFYSESISVLEEKEKEMNDAISNVILQLKEVKSKRFSDLIRNQLLESMEKFVLKSEYNSFNGLLFEFDSSPSFSGIAFKEPNFEIILEEPRYIDFSDGNYACDFSIDFELEKLFEDVLSEEFEEIAWEFEFELDVFQKIKDTVYHIIAINLHEALITEEVKLKLEKLGFEKDGIIYLNEHDMEVKSVFVNK